MRDDNSKIRAQFFCDEEKFYTESIYLPFVPKIGYKISKLFDINDDDFKLRGPYEIVDICYCVNIDEYDDENIVDKVYIKVKPINIEWWL